jgi:hypothetical protein
MRCVHTIGLVRRYAFKRHVAFEINYVHGFDLVQPLVDLLSGSVTVPMFRHGIPLGIAAFNPGLGLLERSKNTIPLRSRITRCGTSEGKRNVGAADPRNASSYVSKGAVKSGPCSASSAPRHKSAFS